MSDLVADRRACAPDKLAVVSVPGDRLDSLIRAVHLSGAEWRITLSILISPVPVSARSVATRLTLDYSFVKRVLRGLVAWRILERASGGLQFQPDTARWRSPGVAPGSCREPSGSER